MKKKLQAGVRKWYQLLQLQKQFWAGFWLSFIIAGIGFIGHGMWPFGDKTMLIVDSLHQYLPFYTDLQQKLVHSDSMFYSFSGGLGYNFWSTYAYYLASPWNFLMRLIPMEHVCDFMDLMILVKIGFCGGFFSWYLSKRRGGRLFQPMVFGTAYALSNYMIGYYFNIMWLDSVAVLPLILLGIEQICEHKKGALYGLALFYGIWCNYYIGFMLCIFSCLYFMLGIFKKEQIRGKELFEIAVHFGWYSFLAGGMAAVLLFPAFSGLSASESMQGNSFPQTIKFYTDIVEMMQNHFIFQKPVTISSNQVGLNIYCGVASVFLAVLYLLDTKIDLRERIAYGILTGFLLLSFSLNLLNYIWHGFHIQNGLPNRFAFLYLAMILIMAYEAIGHVRVLSVWRILLAFLIPAGFTGYVFFTKQEETDPLVFGATGGILVVWLIVLLLIRIGKKRRRVVGNAVVSGLLLAEIAANGVSAIMGNGGVTRSTYVADQTSYQNLMSRQEDSSFFRSEVDRQRMRNVTMFAGGNGMVMFNSTMQGAVIDLCDHLGIEARTNKNGYLGVTKLINDVFGIKYLASPSGTADTLYQFRRLTKDGELTLYKNDNALSLGFMVNSDIKNWDTDQEEPLQVQNDFVTLATGLDPIFILDRYIQMEDGENYGILIPENKQVYLCLDTRVAKIELTTPEYQKTYEDYTDHLYVINGTLQDNMADFTVTLKEGQSSQQAEVYTCADEAYEEVVHELSESQLEQVTVKGNKVSGVIKAAKSGTLMFSIPYDKGWKVLADGEEVETYPIGNALLGIDLEKGTHEIEMRYTPPGIKTGAMISLLCLVLFGISVKIEQDRLIKKKK